MNLLCPAEVFEPVPGVEEIGFTCPQRVLWVKPDEDAIVTIGIQKKLKKPQVHSLQEVMDFLNGGMLQRIEVKLRPYVFQAEEAILRRSLDIRDRAWAIIEPLVCEDRIPDIYLPRTRGHLILGRAAELGLDPKQVYRPLYRYWAYGSCIDALIGCYDLCGPTGRPQPAGSKKRGQRPDRVKLQDDPSLLGPSRADVRTKIVLGIQAFLKPGVTKKKAWEDTKRAYFKKAEIEHGNLLVPVAPEAHEAPSLYQFEQVVKEMDRDFSLTKRNISTTTWNLKHRGVLGSSRHRLFGPAARFEIDATIVDVYLVSVFNRAWLIGRPVLYVVVDVFSRMVVGFYLGLEGPSWEGARLALFNAFSDKAEFCRQLGIDISSDLWPCRHLPHKLLCDNGELKSKASDALPKEFGITIQNAAVRRPDWKPNVEQQFNLINNHTIHFEPGALNRRLDEMKRRHCSLDASLTLPELTRILAYKLIEYNLSAYHADALPDEMLGENFADATPLTVWNWGMEHLTGGAKAIEKQKVWTKLLPAATASVRRDGIYFHGRRYASERAVSEEWFARARTKGKVQPIEIRHLPYAPAHIWILNAASREWEPCELLDSNEKYRLARLEEVLDRAKLLGLEADRKASELRQVCATLDAECDAITAAAKKAAAQAKQGLSKTEKKANVQANRAFEKTAERVEHARDAAQSYCEPSAQDNVVKLRPDMRKQNPLDDIWGL
jgi:putative transposase